MRYYALYDNNKLTAIGTGSGGTEITKTEYDSLLAEIQAKAKWVDDVYGGAELATAPPEWQEEIQRRLEQRREWDAAQKAEELKEQDELSQLQIENAELTKQVEALQKRIDELELQSGGSVKPGGDIPYDPKPGTGGGFKPKPGGGLTIGG